MSLTLYMHPLASFCHKVLIALYENDTAFEPVIVDLADPAQRARLTELWPIGRFPVLRDNTRDCTVAESSIIIEYLAQHHAGAVTLLPTDRDAARETRLRDRFFDLYVHEPMQKIVVDRLRPAGCGDAFGVEQARAMLRTSYAMIDADMATRRWACGEQFGMADCAAAPALFYAQRVAAFGPQQWHLAAYFDRLLARPSFTRVIAEAQPYFAMFPG